MNLRKFYLIVTIFITLFLCISGIIIIKSENDSIMRQRDEYADSNTDNNLNNSIDMEDKNNNTDSNYTDNTNTNNNNDNDNNNEDQNNTTRPDTNTDNNIGISTKPINILLLGGDKVNNNTDTIMVINFDPITSNINLLSIPRDTKVRIEGEIHKLNYAYPHGGANLAIKTISNFLDINIDRYIYIDTSVFRNLIDLLGGVEYYVPVDMDYDDDLQDLHIHLKKGQQTLYGEEAEQFMRFRKPNSDEEVGEDFEKYYNGSDIKRINAQQDFIKELIKQKASSVSNWLKIKSILDVIFDELKTDFLLNEVLDYAFFIDSISLDNLRTFKLSGYDEVIDDIWFLTFDNKIYYDNRAYSADSVLNKYFKTNQNRASIETDSENALSE